MDAWFEHRDRPPSADHSLNNGIVIILAVAIAIVLGFMIAGSRDQNDYHSDMPPGVEER